jgi:4-amino-4-deoxy-L-arabinose transferase-like glycosyltransferase
MGFALPVWRSLRANWTAQTSFLAAWFLAPQLIFFFYATQLPHYVMPGYPAFIVLLALAWQNRSRAVPAVAKWLTLGLGILIAGGWMFAMQIQQGSIRDLMGSALLVLTCVLAAGGAVACAVWSQGMTRRNTGLVCLTVALTSLSLTLLGQQLRATSVPVRVAEQLGTLTPNIILHGCGYTEPSLVFYTNHLWEFTDDVSEAKRLLQQSGPVAVVVLKREWTLDRWFKGLLGTAPKGTAAKDFTASLQIESVGVQSQMIEGFNVARFSWAEAQLLIKR